MSDIDTGGRRTARIPLKNWLQKLKERGLSGAKFTPDPTPMAPPIGYKKQPSMVEHIREIVRSERLAQEAAAQGMETFEESEDFDVDDDDPQLHSEWENDFDPPIEEVMKAGKEAIAEKEAAAKKAASAVKAAEGAREGLDQPEPE